MRPLSPHLPLDRWRVLAVAGLLACAPKHLTQQAVPAFPDAARAAPTLPANRRLMASGGSSTLGAHATEQGVVVAEAWAGGGADSRWRYLLFSASGDGAWTWESPAGEAYGALHLGSGATVDLLVEDTGPTGTARWIAIDRVARRPLASGALAGPRCGDVLNLGVDRFAFGSGDRLMYWQRGMSTPVSLREEPGPVCLRSARGSGAQRELFWVQGGATPSLRQAVLTLGVGQTLGGLADLTWPDPQVPVKPDQAFRVLDDAKGGFDLVYQVDAAPGSAIREGLRRASYGADGALLGAPTPLTDPVGCAGRWDAVSTPGGPVVIRCADDGRLTPSSPDLPLRALPNAPGWSELALHHASDAALVCGPQGCDLWTELDGRGGLVRARLGHIDGVDPAREGANRDAAARAVHGLLHSDNKPDAVMDLARKVCVPAEALEKRMGPGAEGPPTPTLDTRIWSLPEGVITARFSPATGCLSEVEVVRYPPRRR